MALDPGSHSGLAWGVVRDVGMVRERVADRTDYGSMTIQGKDLDQVRLIESEIRKFSGLCQILEHEFYFVCEDFILTRFMSSDRSGLSSPRIASMLHGYRQGLLDTCKKFIAEPVQCTYQQPSDAMRYATDARLKDWGLWVRGREHERDAWRHWCLFIANRAKRSRP